MKKEVQNNLHLVPQVIIDIGNNYYTNRNSLNADMHRHRLEVIRDYCQEIINVVDKELEKNIDK